MTNPPLTQEQLDYFASETARAAHKATKKTLRAAFIGYLALFIGVVGMYSNGQSVSSNERDEIRTAGRAVAITACNERYNDRVEIREVLVQAQRSVKRQHKAGIVSDEQYKDAVEFYNERLEGLPLPDCRKADNALETTEKVAIPEARYPNDGKG